MTEQSLAPATPATAGKRILLIEPSASLCEMLAFALRSQRHSVTCVPDATRAYTTSRLQESPLPIW